MKRIQPIAATLLLALVACSDVEEDDHHDHGHHHHEHEVMTTVKLTFVPSTDGAEDLVFTWADPENDGDPVVDDIVLENGVDYAVGVEIWNELEEEPEEVTPEIADEDDEHQAFFTGSAVQGPANTDNPDHVVTHAYADEDRNGLPLGLDNTIVAVAAGTGELTFTLRHMPLEDGNSVKVEGLAGDVDEGGFSAIGGANDIQITYSLTVE
jgi:hypothetical protein